MRVATYNIHRCIGADGRARPRRVLRVLEALDADVVALQEVESRDSGDDPLHLFCTRLGYHVVRGPTLTRDGSAYGNALLCRDPAECVERIDLTVRGREARGAIDVRLSNGASRLRVIATHLGLRPAERRMQIKRLMSHLGELDAAPVVLMGDLNEWFLWGRPLRYLHRMFSRVPAYATYPAGRPLLALDRIWVHPKSWLRGLRVLRSHSARVASDHLPVVASLAPGPSVRSSASMAEPPGSGAAPAPVGPRATPGRSHR